MVAASSRLTVLHEKKRKKSKKHCSESLTTPTISQGCWLQITRGSQILLFSHVVGFPGAIGLEELLLELPKFYDDMDLPCGVLHLHCKGGHGSHSGLKSVIYQFQGSRDYPPRLRIGIGGPPELMHGGSQNVLASEVQCNGSGRVNCDYLVLILYVRQACDRPIATRTWFDRSTWGTFLMHPTPMNFTIFLDCKNVMDSPFLSDPE